MSDGHGIFSAVHDNGHRFATNQKVVIPPLFPSVLHLSLHGHGLSFCCHNSTTFMFQFEFLTLKTPSYQCNSVPTLPLPPTWPNLRMSNYAQCPHIPEMIHAAYGAQLPLVSRWRVSRHVHTSHYHVPQKKPSASQCATARQNRLSYSKWVHCISGTYSSILAISLTASTPPGRGSRSMKKSFDSQILMALSWSQNAHTQIQW